MRVPGVIVLLLLSVLSDRVYPCPARAVAEHAPQDQLEGARRAAIKKLKQRDPTITGVDTVPDRGEYHIRLWRGETREVLERSYFEPAIDWERSFYTYDIGIPAKYRDCGLNRFFVAQLLARHPQLGTARLNLAGSNAKAFFGALLGVDKQDTSKRRNLVTAAVESLLSNLSNAQGANARDRILAALVDGTPAGRIQKSLGMGRAVRVVVAYTPDYSQFEIVADFKRNSSEAVAAEIFLAEVFTEDSIRGEIVSYKQILEDGTTRKGRGVVVH